MSYTQDFAKDMNSTSRYNQFMNEFMPQFGELTKYFGMPERERVDQVSTAPTALPTLESLWSNKNTVLATKFTDRINNIRTWLTVVFPLKRSDDLSKKTIIKIEMKPTLPDQLASLGSVGSNDFTMGERSFSMTTYGLGAKFEINMLRGPLGPELFRKSVECLQESVYLGMVIVGVTALTDVGHAAAARERVNGGPALRTVGQVLEMFNRTWGIYNKYERGDPKLDQAVADIRKNALCPPAKIKIVPQGTVNQLRMSDYYNEASRIGEENIKRLLADPANYRPFANVPAMIEEDYIYAHNVGDNPLYDPLGKSMTIGFYWHIDQRYLDTYTGGPHPTSALRGMASFDWDDGYCSYSSSTSAQDFIDNELSFDPQTGLLRYDVLERICQDHDQLMKGRRIVPRKNADGDYLLDPHIAVQTRSADKVRRYVPVQTFGEMDLAYSSIKFMKNFGRGNRLSMEHQLGAETIGAMDRGFELLDRAYTCFQMKGSPSDPSLTEAYMVSLATNPANAPETDDLHITRGNNFGVDNMSPLIKVGNEWCIASMASGKPRPLYAIRSERDNQLIYTELGPSDFASANVSTDGLFFTPMTVPKGFIPPCGASIAHAHYYASLYGTNWLVENGWQEVNPDFFKAMYEMVRGLTRYTKKMKSAYSPASDNPNIGRHELWNEANLAYHHTPPRTSGSGTNTYLNDLAFAEAAFDFYKPPLAVGGLISKAGFAAGPSGIKLLESLMSGGEASSSSYESTTEQSDAFSRLVSAVKGSDEDVMSDGTITDLDARIAKSTSIHADVIHAITSTKGTQFGKLRRDALQGFRAFSNAFNSAYDRTNNKAVFRPESGNKSAFVNFLNDTSTFKVRELAKKHRLRTVVGLNLLYDDCARNDVTITKENLMAYLDGTMEKTRMLPTIAEETSYLTEIQNATTPERNALRYIITRSSISSSYWSECDIQTVYEGVLRPVDPTDPFGKVINAGRKDAPAGTSERMRSEVENIRKFARAGAASCWGTTTGQRVGTKRSRGDEYTESYDDRYSSRSGRGRIGIDPTISERPSRSIASDRLAPHGQSTRVLDNILLESPIALAIRRSKWLMARVDVITTMEDRYERAHALAFVFARVTRQILHSLTDNNLVLPRTWYVFSPFVNIETAAAIYTIPNAGELLYSVPTVLVGVNANIGLIQYRLFWGMGAYLTDEKNATVVPAVLIKRYISGHGHGFISPAMTMDGLDDDYTLTTHRGVFNYREAMRRPRGCDRFVVASGCDWAPVTDVVDLTGQYDHNLFASQVTDPVALQELQKPCHPAYLFIDMVTKVAQMNADGLSSRFWGKYFDFNITHMVNTLCYQGAQRNYNMKTGLYDVFVSDGAGPMGSMREGCGPVLNGEPGFYSIQMSTAPAQSVTLV